MKRSEIPENMRWRLEDIYADEALLEQDFAKLDELCGKLAALKGTLANGPDALLAALEAFYEARSVAEHVYAYTHMRRDEDNANGVYQAFCDRALGAVVRLEEAGSYFSPEMLAVPEETVLGWLRDEPKLGIYERFIKETLRMRAHTLDEQQERLLAMAGEIFSAPDTIFTMLNNADMKFPDVPGEDGKPAKLTHGTYALFLDSRDREVRRGAYEAIYDSYKKQINTIAATYSASVKTDVFTARARNYESALHAALESNEVPQSVYDNLLAAVESHAQDMGRYLQLRKKKLGIDDLRFFDLYVPLTDGFELKLPYEEALDIVRKGLEPLGEQYMADLNHAFDSRWIDVCENEGKTSGAYSWGVHGVHPFVLLNYQRNTDNIFTIAHEMGHAMHSFYSAKTQPYPTAEYVIFVAEVASTVNEMLLLDHLLKNASSDGEKAALLNHKLEAIRTTLYRQTMFAAFEKISHELFERGGALTPDILCKAYEELNRKYYPGVEMDECIPNEWARIPHFYRAFYVYQYATGLAAAVALSRRILDGVPGALESYLSFLKSGGSDAPLNLLRAAGVDLTTPEPVESCMREFAKTLDELEMIL